jgi:CRISPR-associated protein Csb1
VSVDELYGELVAAVALEGDRAVIRITTTYEPAGGAGSRVFPPTYPRDRDSQSPYVLEERRIDGDVRRCVLMDAVPSQANRAEEALLGAFRQGRVSLPLLEIRHKGLAEVTLTSLELPHRYADAYLRDSLIDGVKFDKTDIGRAFQAATLQDATSLYRHDPGSLVFGAWNSHRKGQQAKFPRVYGSEIIGWDPSEGNRKAGRMDPLNLRGGRKGAGDNWEFKPVEEKKKEERLSEIGLGNIAPNDAPGGVTITSATRFATVSPAALDRIGFGSASHPAALAARALLAAYALLADRLAFGGPSLWLRSGCELITVEERLEWVNRGGGVETFELGVPDSLALFAHAVEVAGERGLPVSTDTVSLVPGPSLAEAIDFSLVKADTGEN